MYIYDIYHYKFKARLGRISNNKAKLMDSKLVLMVVVEKGIQKLKIIVDSILVIDWLWGDGTH